MLSWQHLSFLPKILINLWVGLSPDMKPVLEIMVYQHCYQLFLHLRLKFLIKLSYLIFLTYVNSRFKFKALITEKHKAIIFSKLSSSSFPYNWDNVIRVIQNTDSTINYKESMFDIYLLNTFHNHPIIVQKAISNVF